MSKIIFILIFILFFGALASARDISPSEIKKILIQDSISSYPGNCPCPYNTDRAGRRCGKRSAYNRAGGYAPLCFEDDITQEMISAYKK